MKMKLRVLKGGMEWWKWKTVILNCGKISLILQFLNGGSGNYHPSAWKLYSKALKRGMEKNV